VVRRGAIATPVFVDIDPDPLPPRTGAGETGSQRGFFPTSS
jgi:hypothetical protein